MRCTSPGHRAAYRPVQDLLPVVAEELFGTRAELDHLAVEPHHIGHDKPDVVGRIEDGLKPFTALVNGDLAALELLESEDRASSPEVPGRRPQPARTRVGWVRFPQTPRPKVRSRAG